MREPTPVEHCCEPFLSKNEHSEWLTYSWKNDGYYNGRNLPRAYIVGNTLHYQDLKWRWDDSTHNHEMNDYTKTDEERCNDTANNAPVCKIRRFKMITYSFGQDEEYVAIKECECDDLTKTNEDACRAYQGILRSMDEGWVVTRAA
nr:hypothetical protein [Tanacetum cinerariifolium]